MAPIYFQDRRLRPLGHHSAHAGYELTRAGTTTGRLAKWRRCSAKWSAPEAWSVGGTIHCR